MSDAMKREEMERLLRSNTRYALIDAIWWAMADVPGPIRETLRENFRPVRHFGSIVVLERDASAGARALAGIQRRSIMGHPTPGDLGFLREIARTRPDDPLVADLIGVVLDHQHRYPDAIRAFETAHRLDPSNPRPLELAARAARRGGYRAAASRFDARAKALREP